MYVNLTLVFVIFILLIDVGLLQADKSLRRYGATVDRALTSWEISPPEWADYIAFLGRLLKVRSIKTSLEHRLTL